MYERNAIVIDRYFANLFGYDQNNNLKNNSVYYFELVSKLEEYQIAFENENNIMMEYENVANKIRETQKLQESLNKKNQKLLEQRKALFESLDEDAESLNNKFNKVEEDIIKNDNEIRNNIEKFVDETKEFHEKTEIRTECGRERRIKEGEYQKSLKNTTDNFTKINKERLKEIKTFIKSDSKTEEKEKIRDKIFKNGAKEKIPFDANVINKSIDVSTDIEQKRVEILLSIYDKTGKLLDEIKNDNIKIEKHKKIVKDAKSKLEFLNVIDEYVILFLDNERMNTIGGENEHQRIMQEACENAQKDLIEIQNMYALLIKEITDKSSKKAYKDLYNLEYLYDLQDEETKFETNISKLNMAGTVIYPQHWRIEGLEKIYDTFQHLVTDVYGKDLSEFEPIDVTTAINEDIMKFEDVDEENEEDVENTDTEDITNNQEKVENEKNEDIETEAENEEENVATENDEPEEEEFQWDDDDIDDELIFENSTIFDDENEEDEEENDNEHLNNSNESDEDEEDDEELELEQEEEEKRDEEIDKILGFFDDEEELEDDALINFDMDNDEPEEEIIEKIEENEEEDVEEEQEENNKSKDKNKAKEKEKKDKDKKDKEKKEKKKMSLFGRRKK